MWSVHVSCAMAALPSNTDRSTYTHSGHTLHVCDHLDDDDGEFITLIARVSYLLLLPSTKVPGSDP